VILSRFDGIDFLALIAEITSEVLRVNGGLNCRVNITRAVANLRVCRAVPLGREGAVPAAGVRA
jgi:hypothetical protein